MATDIDEREGGERVYLVLLSEHRQAQVDLARFEVEFTDKPGVRRIVWLFSMVLGFSRLIWALFVVHQDLQSVLRCHIAALDAVRTPPATHGLPRTCHGTVR